MRRNAEAICRNRKPRFKEKTVGELWGFHIESAHAELAVAKALGVWWGFGVNTFHTSDIAGTDCEIRWSPRNNVKIRPDDTGTVISVTGKCPTYEIKGWIAAEDGKKPEWYCSQPPPCYFVPHTKLIPFEEFAILSKELT
jgi:hypothetical protein